MNELDWLLLFVIVVGVAIGLRRGLVRVLISIVGIYITVLIAGYAHDFIGDTLADGFNLGRTMMRNFTYLVFVIATTILVELGSRMFFEGTRIHALRGLDNLLGGIVGALYGALWASLLLVPVQYGIAQTPSSAWSEGVRESALVPTLNSIFQGGVLDIISFLFVGGIPKLYRNPVSQRVLYLFFNLASLRAPLF